MKLLGNIDFSRWDLGELDFIDEKKLRKFVSEFMNILLKPKEGTPSVSYSRTKKDDIIFLMWFDDEGTCLEFGLREALAYLLNEGMEEDETRIKSAKILRNLADEIEKVTPLKQMNTQ
jgi:hypothetical protein